MVETHQLLQLMQILPQELFDKIYDLTFMFNVREEVMINSEYKPPSVLAVNKVTRAQAARQFYTNVTFITGYRRPLARWLFSIPKGHRPYLDRIDYGVPFYDMDEVALEAKSIADFLVDFDMYKDVAAALSLDFYCPFHAEWEWLNIEDARLLPKSEIGWEGMEGCPASVATTVASPVYHADSGHRSLERSTQKM